MASAAPQRKAAVAAFPWDFGQIIEDFSWLRRLFSSAAKA
jgi:hypothetical protein